MIERCELKRYADNLSGILNMRSVAAVSERPLEANEQGFSEAELIRLAAVFDDGRQESFICKKAGLKERMVMRKFKFVGKKRKAENHHKYIMGGIIVKYFPECYSFKRRLGNTTYTVRNCQEITFK